MEQSDISHVTYCEKCKKYFYPNRTFPETGTHCPVCTNPLQDTGKTSAQFQAEQPTSEELIMKKLRELKETDPVKYEIAMAKYKQKIVNDAQNKRESGALKCPKCNSTQIQMVQRKWSLLTGFLTNKVDRVCVNCKHKF